MNTTLNASEILALRFFAAATFPTDEQAPSPGMCADLAQRGYLRRMMGSYVLTTDGELELQVETIVQAARTPIHAYSRLSGLALREGMMGDWTPQARRAHDRVLARRDALASLAGNAW